MYNDFKRLDFSHLNKTESKYWLNGDIIDLLMKFRERNSIFTYIDHYNARSIIEGKTVKNEIIEQIQMHSKENKTIVMVYSHNYHWYLIFISLMINRL
jgi:hypothetical protein